MAADVQGTPATPGGGGGGGALTPGQRVGAGRYTLERQLGQGGMGTVWLAKDEQLGDEVALKFLAREITHDADAIEELRRETLKSRKLSHPHIIRIHDLHQAPGEAPFISMEYVEGQSLSKLKAQQPQRCFSWACLKPLVKQLCDGLSYAHSQKVIHRDLKPANMMLNSNGGLKLADFGLAAVLSESMSRTSLQRSTSGTPAYMSPQQMDGRPPKVTDDVYALGATLYELLTSKPPFYHGDIPYQVRQLPPDPLAQRLADLELANEVPPDVAALIMVCLAKEPEQRPQSAGAVAEWIGLETKAESSAQTLAQEVSEAEIVEPQHQQDATEPAVADSVGGGRGVWWIGVAMATLLLVAIGGWFGLSKRDAAKTQDSSVAASATVQASLTLPQTPTQQPPPAVSATPIAETGLVLYLSFDEPPNGGIILDLSGQGNHGHVEGATWAPDGRRGGAMRFDIRERTQRVRVPNSVSLNPKRVTIAAWIKSADTDEFWNRIVDKNWEHGYNFCLGGKMDNGADWSGRVGLEINRTHCTYSGVPAADGQWHHVAATYDGEIQLLYVDGGLLPVRHRWQGEIASNVWDLCIGNRLGTSDPVKFSAFNGLIDEVRIYDHALSAEEVAALVGMSNSSTSGVPAPQTSVASATPTTTATPTGQHWTNSLGMVFVPVLGTKVLFSIWETRVQDFEAFVRTAGFHVTRGITGVESNRDSAEMDWTNPGFPQSPTHPACAVSWADGQAFCQWLTARERAASRLASNQLYRLPTDAEWSQAAGPTRYPWGDTWPPPPGAGNYAGEEAKMAGQPINRNAIAGFRDGFARTAPVGSFPPNQHGLFDLGGNVWEWCQDVYRKEMNTAEVRSRYAPFNDDGSTQKFRYLRGASWYNGNTELGMDMLLNSLRHAHTPDLRDARAGFRIVLSGPGQLSSAGVNVPISAQNDATIPSVSAVPAASTAAIQAPKRLALGLDRNGNASVPALTSAGAQWTPLFDGRTFAGWAADKPAQWRVGAGGVVAGVGPNAYLVSTASFTNLEYKAVILASTGGNGGMHFRVIGRIGKAGHLNGYEVQVNNTDNAFTKTGGLWRGMSPFKDVDTRLVADNTWFTQHVIAVGKRIIILVNGKVAVDCIDDQQTYTSGNLGLQSFFAGRTVTYRNVMVKPLPAEEKTAWAEVLREHPQLRQQVTGL